MYNLTFIMEIAVLFSYFIFIKGIVDDLIF